MARSLKEAYWLHEENVSSVLFPRSYDPSAERRAFLDDFRLTAAASLLKWFAHVMTTSEEVLVIGPTERRTIPISRLDFAVERCQEFIDIAMHEDLDAEQREKQLSDEEWDSFLNDYTAIMHQGAGIDGSPDDSQEQLQVREDKGQRRRDRPGFAFFRSDDAKFSINFADRPSPCEETRRVPPNKIRRFGFFPLSPLTRLINLMADYREKARARAINNGHIRPMRFLVIRFCYLINIRKHNVSIIIMREIHFS